MSDPTPTPDDELVSAVLDGEASADEVRRVEADPVLAGRLAEFRAIAADVGRVPAGPAPGVDTAVNAALDALRHPDAPPMRDELAARRARRLQPVLFAAAAVVAIVALVVGVGVLASDDGDDASTAATFGDDGDASAESAELAPAERDADDFAGELAPSAAADSAPDSGGAGGSTGAASLGDRFDAASLDDLEGRVREALAVQEESADGNQTTTTQAARECNPRSATSRETADEVLFADGTLDGDPILIAVYETARGRVLVVTDPACQLVAEIDL